MAFDGLGGSSFCGFGQQQQLGGVAILDGNGATAFLLMVEILGPLENLVEGRGWFGHQLEYFAVGVDQKTQALVDAGGPLGYGYIQLCGLEQGHVVFPGYLGDPGGELGVEGGSLPLVFRGGGHAERLAVVGVEGAFEERDHRLYDGILGSSGVAHLGVRYGHWR